MKRTLKFLGTGGSVGIPVIGCSCPVCHSTLSYNQRLRPSVLIKEGNQQFLIDAGPDFRYQALKNGITDLKGVLFTHAHYDHTAGLDDLRTFYFWQQIPLPLLLSSETAKDIERRFYYLFHSNDENFSSKFKLQLLPSLEGDIVFEGLTVHYMTYKQGNMSVNGYRMGNLAYLTDIRQFSPTIIDQLNGIKTLIISALRRTPSPLHFSIDEAIDFSRQVKAEKVWLTHISHELEHEQTNAYLPSNIRLAYDGLEIDFE